MSVQLVLVFAKYMLLRVGTKCFIRHSPSSVNFYNISFLKVSFNATQFVYKSFHFVYSLLIIYHVNSEVIVRWTRVVELHQLESRGQCFKLVVTMQCDSMHEALCYCVQRPYNRLAYSASNPLMQECSLFDSLCECAGVLPLQHDVFSLVQGFQLSMLQICCANNLYYTTLYMLWALYLCSACTATRLQACAVMLDATHILWLLL